MSPEVSTDDLGHLFLNQSSHHREVTPIPDEMEIQRKPRSTLQELLESQPGRDVPGKAAQTKLPTPPPNQTPRADPVDHKRKRVEKGKEVVEIRGTHPFQEVEPQRGAK